MYPELNLRRHRLIYRQKWAPMLNRRLVLYADDTSKSGLWINRDTGKCRMCNGVIYEFSWSENTEYPRLCGRCRYGLRQLLWSHNTGIGTDEIPF